MCSCRNDHLLEEMFYRYTANVKINNKLINKSNCRTENKPVSVMVRVNNTLVSTKEKKLIWAGRQIAHKYWPFLQTPAGRRSKVKVETQTKQSRNQSRRTWTNFTLKRSAVKPAISETSGGKKSVNLERMYKPLNLFD